VRKLEAVYLGPGQVLVAADVRMDPRLDAESVAHRLVALRTEVCRDVPAVARLYLTPVD
jgi:hypothetical protein